MITITNRVTASVTPFLRIQEMLAIMNMSRSTLYRKVKEEEGFPKPVPFGPSGGKRWRREAVVAYLTEKLGFDASQLVSECLTLVREQMRERSGKPRKKAA